MKALVGRISGWRSLSSFILRIRGTAQRGPLSRGCWQSLWLTGLDLHCDIKKDDSSIKVIAEEEQTDTTPIAVHFAFGAGAGAAG
jgi:hypothetical protein